MLFCLLMQWNYFNCNLLLWFGVKQNCLNFFLFYRLWWWWLVRAVSGGWLLHLSCHWFVFSLKLHVILNNCVNSLFWLFRSFWSVINHNCKMFLMSFFFFFFWRLYIYYHLHLMFCLILDQMKKEDLIWFYSYMTQCSAIYKSTSFPHQKNSPYSHAFTCWIMG